MPIKNRHYAFEVGVEPAANGKSQRRWVYLPRRPAGSKSRRQDIIV